MALNWVTIFNRLFEIINNQGEASYFSGGRFISKVREVDPYFPEYSKYIDQRNRTGKSTSRKSYFYDILLGFDEDVRMRLLYSILADVEASVGNDGKVQELRALLGGKALAPQAAVPATTWNADRLNDTLQEIDACIAAGKYERAVTLSYTCLEGFYKAFVKQKIPAKSGTTELIALSKDIKQYLKDTLTSYPDEALSTFNGISHMVDRARNGFSESHFADEAGRWLALYVRDLIVSQIRLLLHFM